MSTDGMRTDWANKDFYAELGVTKQATQAEIKKAYRKLARANHPDSNPGDTAKHEKFKAVAEAYDVIGDEDKRKKYDEVRELYGGGWVPGRTPGGAGGFDLNDLLRDRTGGGGFGDLFGDLFGWRGGRQQTRTRAVRGVDVETNATISFMDAMNGVTISLRLTSRLGVPGVSRHRRQARHHAEDLSRVRGRRLRRQLHGRRLLDQRDLPALRADGSSIYDEACPTCHGSGRGTSARSIQARIPAGVKDGQRIRLRGKGGAGENGGAAGDLFVTVKVTPAPALRPHRRQPHARRTGVLRRGRARRRDQDPDARGSRGDPQDPGRDPERAHLPRPRSRCPEEGRHQGRPAGDRPGAGARAAQRRRPRGPHRLPRRRRRHARCAPTSSSSRDGRRRPACPRTPRST